MTKSEVRTFINDNKSGMTSNEIKDYSSTITNKLLGTNEYKYCSTVFCYVSFNQEVLTRDIIINSFELGKKVAVPRIVGNKMIFYYINNFEELKPGTLNILEPITENVAMPNENENNLIIVPGLAFDEKFNRIGYGKGYYDKFFLEYRNIPMYKIALAYDMQVLKELPAETHDIKLDQIITQSKIIL
jgi:5-formyltetrahydrofolate cyclo-ligase